MSALLLLSTLKGTTQIAMPDDVCIGTTKTYQVNNTIGSTYTWKIDGVTQPSTTHQLTVKWDKVGTFEVTVQERTAEGCDGEIQSGYVYVHQLLILQILLTVRRTCGRTHSGNNQQG